MLGPFATASRHTPPVLHCHSPGVATVARRHCRTLPAHRCSQHQRQRVTEWTAMAPWNGPNKAQHTWAHHIPSVLCNWVCGWWCRFSGLLSMTDFDILYPHRAQFLRQLSAIVSQRRLIEADTSLSDDSKLEKIRQLTLGDSSTTIDDIGSALNPHFHFLLVTFSPVLKRYFQNN